MIAKLTRVSKRFTAGKDTIVAVDEVDLTVREGEFVCVYGASGSGKTTLLNLISGIDTADSGDITVCGTSLIGKTESERARIRLTNVGVVFQSNNLLPDLTAVENVTLPLLARGWPRQRSRAAAHHALSIVSVEDLVDRRPADMSGGQRQRVGIARALAGERALLVADEPTGALDSANSHQLFSLLRDLCDEANRAVVLATHDPLARQYSDTTYRMVDGAVTPE